MTWNDWTVSTIVSAADKAIHLGVGKHYIGPRGRHFLKTGTNPSYWLEAGPDPNWPTRQAIFFENWPTGILLAIWQGQCSVYPQRYTPISNKMK